MASRLRLLSLFAGLLGGTAVSCVVSPQPSPPDAILDGDRIGLRPGVELVASVIGFEAAPGTVDPPEGVVVVTNLDANDAPSFADVQPDGSFSIAAPGASGQRYRFQAKNARSRSQPFDIAVSSSGAEISSLGAQPECVVMDPPRWVALDGAGDARSIVIHNQCDAAATIAAPRLRRGFAGFSFSPTKPIQIAPGALATLTVRAGDGNETEDVLFLDLTAPASAQRAITLTVPDR